MSAIAVVVIVFLAVFVIYRINFVKDNEESDTISGYLICTKKDVKDYVLLDGDKYGSANYEVRAMFVNDAMHDMNFIVSQYFSNEQSARVFTDELQAQYNRYTGKNEIVKRDITTTFTNVDNTGKMVLAIKGNALNDKIAPLVMLNSADKNINLTDMQNQYGDKGFYCSVSEEDMVLSD